MFVDTSVVVAILSQEDDAGDLSRRLEAAPVKFTSPLVILEAAMRLSTKLDVEPLLAHAAIAAFLQEADMQVMQIESETAALAVGAFQLYGKGRGHPAQLNLADCMSYACAKGGQMPLLYKGNDFAKTDLA